MFKALREKLSGWFGKKREEKAETVRKPKKEKKEVKKVEKKTSKKEVKKPEKEKAGKNGLEKSLKARADKIKEEVPVKFEVARQKFEPDIDKIKEEMKEGTGEEKELEKKESFFGKVKKAVGFGKEEAKEEIQERAEELEKKIEGKKELFDKQEIEYEITDKKIPEESLAFASDESSSKKGFFGRLAQKLTTSELKENDFNEIFEEFEFALLENNVALGVVDKIKEELAKELIGKRFGKSEVEKRILDALKNAIDSVLIEGENLIKKIKKKEGVFVILFFGINGSGKTTSIAKLTYKLEREGLSCVLAAADTFRAASIEQLEKHASKLGVDIIKSEYGKDPASVAFDAIAYAKKNHKKVVLIDTAGRMYTKTNLMKEMEKIVKVSKPDLKIFVGESITGNDATEQAKIFNETAGIDGIILSKADVDEKAGTILSVSYVTGKPILYLGVGQGYEDLEEFKKENVLKGLGLE